MDAVRRRLRLVSIGLVLPLAATVWLALAYVGAERDHERTLQAASDILMRRLADAVLDSASKRGDQAALSILEPVSRLSRPTTETAFARMRAATDSLRACACGPLKEGAFFFYWEPDRDLLRIDRPLPAGLPASARIHTIRADWLPRDPREITLSAGRDAGGPWLLHLVRVTTPAGRRAVVGFDIAMDSWWTGTFLPAIRQVRQQYFPMLADPDSAFAVGLEVPGRELARDGLHYPGPSTRVVLFPGAPFALHLSANPRVLPLVLSGAGPRRVSPLVGPLLASAVLTLVSLLLMQQLRRAILYREAFAASISHELRTPLTQVLLHAETLQLERAAPATRQRAAGVIVRETRRLIGLVENALALAGAGRTGVGRPATVDLAELVREVLASLEPAIVQRGARIETDLADEVFCQADPVALDRILTNLVENALRYGPEGQTVRIRLAGTASRALLEVEDEGPGIAPAAAGRIWEPFVRGETGKGGVGLGLAIVRRLSQDLGGHCWVVPGQGEGACFRLELPRCPVPALAAAH